MDQTSHKTFIQSRACSWHIRIQQSSICRSWQSWQQNSCSLLKGRETHNIKALSNPKPTHLTFPPGFPLLAHKEGFSSWMKQQLQFGTGTHTHTNPHFSPILFPLPAANLSARDGKCPVLHPQACHSPCGDPSPWKMPLIRTKSVRRTALNYSRSQCPLVSWQTPPEPGKAVQVLHSLGTSCIHSPAVWPQGTYRRQSGFSADVLLSVL